MKKWLCLLTLLSFSNSIFATVILVADYVTSEVTAYELATGEQLGSPFPITQDLLNPLGLATNPSKTLLYIADQTSGEINIYSLSTGQKINTLLSGLPNPSGTTLNSSGTILYVANYGGTPNAYNATTGATIQTYTAGISGCSDVALSPDGNTLYVSNFNGHNVTVYNATTGSQLGFSPITTGIGSASAVAVSLDGNTLYVCSQSSSTITTYNALTGSIISNPFIDSGSGLNSPYGMRLSEDGATLYVGNTGDNSVLAFDSSSGIPIGSPFPITQDISFPGTFAFALSPVSSPTNLSGYQKKDDFALQFELFNQLYWSASPSQISGYYIYRDGVRIATLSASTLSYSDHNRQEGVATTYSVTAFDHVGTESPAVNCVIQ
ncbi:MAG: beta-propeller fold lactonase family protein [Verrucomicrobia bacterium]|nr:beta-propeller fold lactonase family protein [Verrucomicrobiota bacterium]